MGPMCNAQTFFSTPSASVFKGGYNILFSLLAFCYLILECYTYFTGWIWRGTACLRGSSQLRDEWQLRKRYVYIGVSCNLSTCETAARHCVPSCCPFAGANFQTSHWSPRPRSSTAKRILRLDSHVIFDVSFM